MKGERRTNLQEKAILLELKNIITSLLERKINQVDGINNFKIICSNNLHLAEDISVILIDTYDKQIDNYGRLTLLYIVDSLIKNFYDKFIPIFSKDIYSLFDQAFSVADIETRISLFKLYYSWKFFFDSSVLTKISNRFDLEGMKRQLLETHPDIIEKYDKFNKEQEQKILMMSSGNYNQQISMKQGGQMAYNPQINPFSQGQNFNNNFQPQSINSGPQVQGYYRMGNVNNQVHGIVNTNYGNQGQVSHPNTGQVIYGNGNQAQVQVHGQTNQVQIQGNQGSFGNQTINASSVPGNFNPTSLNTNFNNTNQQVYPYSNTNNQKEKEKENQSQKNQQQSKKAGNMSDDLFNDDSSDIASPAFSEINDSEDEPNNHKDDFSPEKPKINQSSNELPEAKKQTAKQKPKIQPKIIPLERPVKKQNGDESSFVTGVSGGSSSGPNSNNKQPIIRNHKITDIETLKQAQIEQYKMGNPMFSNSYYHNMRSSMVTNMNQVNNNPRSLGHSSQPIGSNSNQSIQSINPINSNSASTNQTQNQSHQQNLFHINMMNYYNNLMNGNRSSNNSNVTQTHNSTSTTNYNPSSASVSMQSKPNTLNALENLAKFCRNHADKVKLNENMPLFSSLSKFLNDSSIFKTKGELDKYDNPFEASRKQNIISLIYATLYTELKNICTCCGMRSKYYKDFIDHLDLHFNINLMERNSKNPRKEVSRREMNNKNSWCNQSLSTMNAIISYKEEYEKNQGIVNTKISQENHEDNYKNILRVIDPSLVCIYCGDEFKKVYLNKFRYWFYKNIIKLSKKELESYINIDDDSCYIHESCQKDFVELLSFKAANLKENKDKAKDKGRSILEKAAGAVNANKILSLPNKENMVVSSQNEQTDAQTCLRENNSVTSNSYGNGNEDQNRKDTETRSAFAEIKNCVRKFKVFK